MISREQAYELLTEYYESKLGPEQRRALEERLQCCRVTAHVFATYTKTVTLYQRCLRQKVSPPKDLSDRLLDALRRDAGAKSKP